MAPAAVAAVAEVAAAVEVAAANALFMVAAGGDGRRNPAGWWRVTVTATETAADLGKGGAGILSIGGRREEERGVGGVGDRLKHRAPRSAHDVRGTRGGAHEVGVKRVLG